LRQATPGYTTGLNPMKYKKILLVNPHIPGAYMGPVRPPEGLGYLAESLHLNGIEYDILDMSLGYKLKDLSARIKAFGPDLIGITMWTYKYKTAYGLISAIKNAHPGIPVVAGGAHVSTLRQDVLRDCDAIDFGVTLEGEITLAELCQGKEYADIKGLLYRRGSEVLYTGDREYIDNLDSVSFPRFNGFQMKKYFLKEMLIISSRGCPYDCIYCPVQMSIGKRLRVRSPKNVVDEVEYWYDKGYRIFNFADDNFTFYEERVYGICEEIERRGLSGLDLRCGNGVRADRVNRKLLERMKTAGFRYIAFGVEAGNNKILANLRKNENIEQIETAIKDACDLGYDVTLFFLAGSPGEGWQDIEDSIHLAKKYQITDARFYNIIPYPATELFEYVKERNLFLYEPREYLNNASAFDDVPVFYTPELSRADRVKALRILKNVRKGILNRALKRKLRPFGIIGKIAAILFSTYFGQLLMRRNMIIRRIAEIVRYRLGRRT